LRIAPTAGTVVNGQLVQQLRDPEATTFMAIKITDGQQVVDADTVDTPTLRVHDVMTQLVRDGQDISLRSLQVWADLARQLGPSRLGAPAAATMVPLAYDLFERVLAAQREVVDELVATQRHLAQRCLDLTTTSVGDSRAHR
jgi:hypothetical protein